MRTISILILLLFSFPCFGQDFFKIKDGKVNRSKVEVVTSKLLVDGNAVLEFKTESEEKPIDELNVKFIDVMVLSSEDFGPPLIEFEDAQGKQVTDAFIQLENSEDFVSVKAGKYKVIAIAVNKKTFAIKRQTAFVQVGTNPDPDEPDPDKPDPDKPDVPDDGSFKDVEQKVNELSRGLSRNAEFARVFSTVASELKTINNFTVVSVEQAIKKVGAAVPNYLPEYNQVHEFLKKDSATRSLGREQLIQFYEAIASGLK